MKNKLIYILGGSIVASSLVFGGSAHAAETSRNWSGGRAAKSSYMSSSHTSPAIFGSVEAVTDTSITVSGKSGKQGTTTTYKVDLSKAKISKGLGQGATLILVTTLEVGDKVAVLGTITGNAVEASSVFDKGATITGKHSRKRGA